MCSSGRVLQGIGAMIATLPLVPIALLTGSTAVMDTSLASPEGITFLAWAILLGSAGSWLATWFWVIASTRLPLALSAQLIVTETLFALFYGFIYERRWPTATESLGTAMLIAGVAIGIQLFRQKRLPDHGAA